MKVTIVGLGLIGGSLALDLRGRGFASHVTGVDANSVHCRKAMELALVDEVSSLEAAVQGGDLVILAVPVSAIEKMLPEILSRIGTNVTVTDMGSTKMRICASVENHPRRSQFVPLHPMAGTENSGPEAALQGLFDHKTAVICDPGRSAAEHLSRVERMIDKLKMRKITMGSEEHDLHAAYVSHLSHISSFVLANTVLSEETNMGTIFNLAGGGFESTVRLAKSSPEMWAPIFEQNHEHVVAALESYLKHLQSFHGALVNRDWERARELMANANRIRPALENIQSRREGRK